MKRALIIALLVISTTAAALAQAKYVFYFIGDGMGVNQVNATETYLAALKGQIGTVPLTFASFPASALVTTYSATNGVTDSAAGGTALATGHKTHNGALGVDATDTVRCESIAEKAYKAGAAVGIATSVSPDHATPAAFYAHVPSRKQTYDIGVQLAASGFDFFAGSDFLTPERKGEPSLYDVCRRAGYAILRGRQAFVEKPANTSRVLLLQSEAASQRDRSAIPYAIDRRKGDGSLTLVDITRSAIEHLSQKAEKTGKGFFLMVEGGKIDWACHANDAHTMLLEVADMDSAVQEAVKFYRQHPDETLIVVTADHETGGLALGTGDYTLHTERLAGQTMSAEAYTHHLATLRASMSPEAFTFDTLRADLKANWGFGERTKLTKHNEKRLSDAYEKMVTNSGADVKSLYSSVSPVADAARAILAERARMSWASGGHSNGYVPLFAIGAGANEFNGRIDNTEIPKKIAKIAGWQ